MSRRILIAGLTLAMLACHSGPDAPEGPWARYEFSEGSPIPGVTHLVLALPGRETAVAGTALWWRLEVFSGDRRRFTIDLLADGLDFLHVGAPPVRVHRYLLMAEDGAVFEYVDAASGEALLPRIGFFSYLTPRASSVDDPGLPLFERGSWLGKPVHRAAAGHGASRADTAGAGRLTLDSQVLVGTSRSFRDDGSGTDRNEAEATYGQLLAAADSQGAELLRSRTAFDFVYLRRGEAAPAGYAEVRRVRESGEVVVGRP